MKGVKWLKNIKDYRENELKYYVIANLLVCLLMHGILNSDVYSLKLYQQIISLLGVTILSSVIFIFTLLTDSMISSDVKTKLTKLYFFRLYGSKIFSEIVKNNKDNRFLTERALEKYKDIYSNMPKEKSKKAKFENDEWYQIYDKHRVAPMVFISNRDYLLMRDMYISTIILLTMYLISTFLFSWFNLNIEYVLYLLVMISCTLIATHIKSKRFVCNVIAFDLNEEKKEDK